MIAQGLFSEEFKVMGSHRIVGVSLVNKSC